MDSVVVYDAKKMPDEFQQLIDPNRPLPSGVMFFEELFTYADLVRQFLWGVILIPVGALVTVVALFLFFRLDRYSPSYDTTLNTLFFAEIVGVLLLIGGLMFLRSLGAKFRIIRAQQKGETTRLGVFLHRDWLAYQSDDAVKVVPKERFKELKDRDVHFQYENDLRSFTLPSRLVGLDAQRLDEAVATWARQSISQ